MTITTPEEALKGIQESETYSRNNRLERRKTEETLTPLQKRFAFEWVQCHQGATKTAKQCYIDAGGSEKSAAQSASTLLVNPTVKRYIELLTTEMINSTSLSYDEIVANVREVLSLASNQKNSNGEHRPDLKYMLEASKELSNLLQLQTQLRKEARKGIKGDEDGEETDNAVDKKEGIEQMKNIMSALAPTKR